MRCDYRATVTIIYRSLPQYRAAFFDGLRAALREDSIHLRLLYGTQRMNLRKDDADVPWGEKVSHSEINAGGKRLIYQHVPPSIYESALLILMQENCILSNYVIALRAWREKRRVALWGHGVNLQDDPHSKANWWKAQYSVRADWWFAYTGNTASILAAMRYPEERITVVNNAIDTEPLLHAIRLITKSQGNELRNALGIGAGPIGLFCGAMYEQKRIPFLLEAAMRIKQSIPEFELILMGAGPDAQLAREAAAKCRWIHYVGPQFGLDRVPYFAISQVLLMPGAVGLAVLDSFALGTPIITTRYRFHGPEIEYVDNGINGLITDDNIMEFAQAAVCVLRDSIVLESLRAYARVAAAKYSMETMVSKFAEGVRKAIAAPLTTGVRNR
jgi:glycosyltransferase involved in cell wall biosynthesis